jgi:hypothetical protein
MRTALIAVCLLMPSLASAQSTFTVAWDYIGAAPSVVAGYTQTVLIDATVQAGTPTCVQKAGAPADTTCTLTMPKPAAGTHTITVRASKGSTTAEATMAGYDPATAPVPASAIRTIITVTVVP